MAKNQAKKLKELTVVLTRSFIIYIVINNLTLINTVTFKVFIYVYIYIEFK